LNTDRNQIEMYTIGHSNLSADEFVAVLLAHQIRKVVDVRTAPHSRYSPQFNRLSLDQILSEAGFDYVFAGESLGGRPSDPACYKNGQLPPAKADFLKLVDYNAVAKQSWYLRGIDRLLQIAGEDRTAIMCSEEDPNRCHRHHLITQTLLEKGVEVWHIRKSGDCEAATKLEDGLGAEPKLEQAVLL
jgi:uncharacterized protein (DUF488 family)